MPNNRPVKSFVLVAVQFACMAAILVPGPWVATQVGFFTVELVGVVLGTWAVMTMTVKNLAVLPEVKAGSRLVTHGPYQWIRHPMYAAILLVTLALVGEAFSYGRGTCWLILLADLVAKLSYEETVLRKAFPDYDRYRLRTWRLIPWVF